MVFADVAEPCTVKSEETLICWRSSHSAGKFPGMETRPSRLGHSDSIPPWRMRATHSTHTS